MLRRHEQRRFRGGQTLLELIGATTVIALALVPSLRMMSDSLRIGRDTEAANLAATLAASKLEEHLLATAGTFTPAVVMGDFASEGHSQMKFVVVRSDSAADGGIVGVLMSVTATVWDDRDDDDAWDTGEPRSVFASKLARNVAYENKARGS